jgi:hypothetical protein
MIALFPVLWMAITAFGEEQDLYQMKFPLWFHMPPTLKHFRLLFTHTWFGTWVVNTVLLSHGLPGPADHPVHAPRARRGIAQVDGVRSHIPTWRLADHCSPWRSLAENV